MKGFGTVVTGTLISGAVRKEQEVELHPAGKRLRVRGVQVHGQSAEQAIAGQRTALNLAGIETAELARGMVLTPPDLFRPTTKVSARLELLPSAKPLRDRARVHFHVLTAETIAEVSLLGTKLLKPGQSGFARLKLNDPVLLLPGDRFIVRQFSPVVTVGGGLVLDAADPGRRTKAVDRLAFLQTLSNANPQKTLLALPRCIRRRRRMGSQCPWPEAVPETGWLPATVEKLAAELQQGGKLGGRHDLLLDLASAGKLRTRMLSEVEEFHRANPLVAGIGKEELRERMNLRPEVFRSIFDTVVGEKKLGLAGELVHAAGQGVVLRDEEAESKKQIEQAFAKAGLKVPLLKEVLASLPVDKARAQKIVTLLLRERVLVKLADELVFHRDTLDALRRQVVDHKTKTPRLNVANFKDLVGVSRKYAIPLLEYLDRERVTRRVGDERVIL